MCKVLVQYRLNTRYSIPGIGGNTWGLLGIGLCSARIVTLFDLDSTHHNVGGTPFRCLTLSASISQVPFYSAQLLAHTGIGQLCCLSVHIGTTQPVQLGYNCTPQYYCSTRLNSTAANTTSASAHTCIAAGIRLMLYTTGKDTGNACYYRPGCVTPRAVPLPNEKPETRKKMTHGTKPRRTHNHTKMQVQTSKANTAEQQGQRARAAAVSVTHLNKERTPDRGAMHVQACVGHPLQT
jgi:hypothetical protein